MRAHDPRLRREPDRRPSRSSARASSRRRLRGANLIIIDPREIELTQFADVHLQLQPGTNVPLLNAIGARHRRGGLVGRGIPARRASPTSTSFANSSRQLAPEKVRRDICGVPAETIRQAARLYATHKPAMSVHGLGMTEHIQGTEGIMAWSIWRCSPATSASPAPASIRCAARTTCRARRTWAASPTI